jgi:hypothetical protein
MRTLPVSGALKMTAKPPTTAKSTRSLFPFTGDAGLEGGTLHGGSDALDYVAIEDARHDVFGAQLIDD